MMVSDFLVGGFIPTPLKNDGVKVSWDDYSIPNMMGKSWQIPWFQTTKKAIWGWLTLANHYSSGDD